MLKSISKLTWMVCNFFSRVTSQEGARCTFFSSTHRPLRTALLMALSASLKPSADPMAMEVSGLLSSAARSSTRELGVETFSLLTR